MLATTSNDIRRTNGSFIDFKVQQQPLKFFRAGQVFSLCISARFEVTQLSHRRIDPSQLPLEPIATLKARQEQTQKEDREHRLEQILLFPLADMIKYSKEAENGKVFCTLCPSGKVDDSYDKDDWVAEHFRRSHWEVYCKLRGITKPNSDKLPSIKSYKFKSKSLGKRPTSTNSSHISPTDWISLKDIKSTWPVKEDYEIKQTLTGSHTTEPCIRGPVMIRRFVVIKEGLDSCLCLGIHT